MCFVKDRTLPAAKTHTYVSYRHVETTCNIVDTPSTAQSCGVARSRKQPLNPDSVYAGHA